MESNASPTRFAHNPLLSLLCAIFAWLGVAPSLLAQQPVPVPGGQPAISVHSPNYPFPLPGREILRDLSRAEKHLAEQRPLEGLRLLQAMLDRPEDYLLPAENASTDLIDTTLRREILNILARIPRETLLAYEEQYGAEAAAKIREAREREDWNDAAQLSLRYLFTSAGRKLTGELALRHADHGEFRSAALLFERLLLSEKSLGQIAPSTVAMTAYCYLQSADLASDAARRPLEILRRESASLQSGSVAWGNLSWKLPLTPEELLEKLQSRIISLSESPSDQWTLPRQSGAADSLSQVTSPVFSESWRLSTARWKDILAEDPEQSEDSDPEDPLDDLFRRTAARNLPLVPSAVPLIVDDLAVYRTARRLEAVSLATGKIRWASAEADTSLSNLLNRISTATQQAGTNRQVLVSALETRTWNNLSQGSLSSDGTRIYSLEGLGLWGNSGAPDNSNENHAATSREHNRLMAHDLHSGKILWELGGPSSQEEIDPSSAPHPRLRGWFFLGPPLPLSGALYALSEHQREIHLLALDPSTGNPLWSQILLSISQIPHAEPTRRHQGLTPVATDGILLCPTGFHALVAVDLTSRSILWASRTTDPLLASETASPPNRAYRQLLGNHYDLPVVHRWIDSYLQLRGDRILHAPLEAQLLRCHEIWSGKLLWEVPRERGLFVAGEHRGRILVVSRDLLEALALADGKPAWKEPIRISAPSGRGYFEGNYYHLPLMNGELLTIDVERGMIAARRRLQNEKPLGNLVAARGMILSQSYDTLSAYRSVTEQAAEQRLALADPPQEAPGWTLRGLLALHQNNPAQAYADFKRAWQLGQEPSARDLWLAGLVEGLRIDPEAYTPLLDPADESAALDSPWGGLWSFHASREFIRRGQYRSALQLLLTTLKRSRLEDQLDPLGIDWEVSREAWIAESVSALLIAAPPAQHPYLQKLLRENWEARTANPAERHQFLDIIRDLPLGREFISQELNRENQPLTLQRELWLLSLLDQDDPEHRRSALAQLALGLAIRGDRIAAAPHLHRLTTRHADEICFAGLTGRQLLQKWEQDHKLAFAHATAWPTGPVQVEQHPADAKEGTAAASIPLFLDLRDSPRGRMQISRSEERLREFDDRGELRWEFPLARSHRRYSGGKWYHASVGSLIVMTNAVQLVSLDLSRIAEDRTPARIWGLELVDPLEIRGYFNPTNLALFKTMPDRPIRVVDALGGTGAQLLCCTPELVLLHRDDSLVGIDPLTGRTRWKRRFLKTPPEVLAWRDKLYVSSHPADCTLLQLSNGRLLEEQAWPLTPPSIPQQAPVAPRGIPVIDVIASPFGPLQIETLSENERKISLVDPENSTVLWEKTIDGRTQMSLVEGLPTADWRSSRPRELALLAPGGKLETLNLENGRVTLSLTISEIQNPPTFTMIAAPERDLLILGTLPGLATHVHQSAWDRGRLPFGGTILGIDRSASTVAWKKTTSQAGSVLELSAAHPVLAVQSLEHSTERRQENSPPAGSIQRLTLIDRRDGRELHTSQESPRETSGLNCTQVRIDRASNTLRLTFQSRPSTPQTEFTLTFSPTP